MRLIGYVRVSSVGGREGESFISPTVQRERVEQLARAHGHTIVAWQEDLDQPGSRLNRPGLDEAFRLIEQGDADGLAVAKLDRFARSVAGAAQALQRLEDAGAVLLSADLGMDTSTPAGKLMRNVLMALAEFELDRIRENWRDAKGRAIDRGVMIAPYVIAGYRRRADGRLEPDPETAPVIRELFLRRAAGESWRSLAAFAGERIPGHGWALGSITSLIKSRTYLGELRHGDDVNLNAHEPLVTRAEWEAAQMVKQLRPPRKVGSLLAGIVRCAGCGYAMSRETSGRRFGATQYWRYGCRKQHAGGRCPAPTSIAGPALDGYVTGLFLARVAAEPAVAIGEPPEVRMDAAVAAVENAEAELAAYRDANLVTIIGADAYRAGLADRARTVDEARAEIAAMRGQLPQAIPGADLANVWDDLALEERRQILAAGLNAVFVKRAHLSRRGTPVNERAIVLFDGEGPDELAGRDVREMLPFVF